MLRGGGAGKCKNNGHICCEITPICRDLSERRWCMKEFKHAIRLKTAHVRGQVFLEVKMPRVQAARAGCV